jgi:lipid-A-disaccharide synthase
MLIEALQRQSSAANLKLEIVALGGSRMAKAGAVLLGDTSSIGSVGILEVLPYIWPTLKIQRQAKQYLRENPPDLVVLIDYVGPNLSILQYVKRFLPDVPVVYYIAPQDWIWSFSPRNTTQVVANIDRLLAIFPAEAEYFQKKGANVSWVGHPLLDRMQSFSSREVARSNLGIKSDCMAIALFPASRPQEIKYLLPIIFQAAQQIQAQLPDASFWIPLSLEAYRHPIEQALKFYNLRATIVSSQTQDVLAAADLAITKSGTVNLELALLNVPQVVIYRVNPITFWIATQVFKFSIPFMSPVNLVEMRLIVPELLQEQATPLNIVSSALKLLLDPVHRAVMIDDYKKMRQSLGEVGACERAAREIFQLLP